MPDEIKNRPKKPREKVDRIPFTEKSLDIIDSAIKSICEKYPGVRINRRGFANWLVTDYFQKLTPASEKLIYEKFYDEIKYLEKSLQELKKRKKNGEEVSIAKILKQAGPRRTPTPRKKEPQKEKVTTPLRPLSPNKDIKTG